MKSFKEIRITAKEVDTIVCNLCGEPISKNCWGLFDDHISIEKTWGYGSVYDGETHAIDICQNCYHTLKKSFAVQPDNDM